jgi:Ca2+/Na+ antiporter
MALIDIFPSPEEMPLPALCVMMFFYGYVLMKASAVIGDGSEMLMLLYGPGIVGGLIIPILGAVPDCAVILISGMGEGTPSEVQHQLSVGVGTLVGSTVMLLTIPWGLGIFLGRRDYDPVNDCAASTPDRKPLLTHTSLWTNCCTTLPDIPQTSQIMIASLAGYLLIQLPSFVYSHDADEGVKREHPWALGCMIFSIVSFGIYCYSQVKGAAAAEQERRLQEALRREQWRSKLDRKLGERNVQEMVRYCGHSLQRAYTVCRKLSCPR